MRILNNLLKLFSKKKVVHIDLDSESVRTHNTIRALANENAELKTEKAKLLSELGKLRKSKKDKEEEEEVKFALNEQKNELEKKSYPKFFSLKSFFKKILTNKEFAKKVGFYSWNGETKLGKFGDIGLGFDGRIYLLDDKKNIIIHGETLHDIFRRIPALHNDLKAGMIPINLDEELGYMENIEVWEAPEIIPTLDGKFKYAKARKRPLYEYLAELRAKISEQQETIEELEMTITKLQEENDELKIAQRVAEDSAETVRAELSQAEKNVSAIERIFRATERELSQLRDANMILEDNLEKLEKQVETLRKEAEREGVKLSFDKALETIENIKRNLVKDMPEKEVQIIEKPTGTPTKT